MEGADVLLEQNLKVQGLDAGWTDGPAALAFASGSAATATVISGLAGRGGHIVSVGVSFSTLKILNDCASSVDNLKTHTHHFPFFFSFFRDVRMCTGEHRDT